MADVEKFGRCPHCGNDDRSLRIYACLDPRGVGCTFRGCWNASGDGCWGTHIACLGCGATGPRNYEYVGHVDR